MGHAWVAQSIKHPNLSFLQGIHIETFEMWGEYVVGPEVAALRRADGATPLFEDMDAEFAVRSQWWDNIRETGCTLNHAMLMSMGANPQKTPSGL